MVPYHKPWTIEDINLRSTTFVYVSSCAQCINYVIRDSLRKKSLCVWNDSNFWGKIILVICGVIQCYSQCLKSCNPLSQNHCLPSRALHNHEFYPNHFNYFLYNQYTTNTYGSTWTICFPYVLQYYVLYGPKMTKSSRLFTFQSI